MRMDSILSGAKPTDVLKAILAEEATLTNRDLAHMFVEAFPDVSGEAVQAIWHWRSPARDTGTSDQLTDEYLIRSLREAGYLEVAR